MAVIGGSFGVKKPKPNTDLSTKTDAELDTLEKTFSGKKGFATGLVLKSIASERQRRANAKPPETPPAPDASQAASEGAAAAQTASVRQRKRSAAGSAGFVRPKMGLGSIAVMPVLSSNSLLGG